MNKKDFGKRIQAARKSRGYTSEKLAEIADLSQATIIEIERGNRLPSLPVFIKLADILNVRPDYLLAGEIRIVDETILNDLLNQKIKDLNSEQFALLTDVVQTMLQHF